jgi:hypothetical protein
VYVTVTGAAKKVVEVRSPLVPGTVTTVAGGVRVVVMVAPIVVVMRFVLVDVVLLSEP